jgi:hypothetical protein
LWLPACDVKARAMTSTSSRRSSSASASPLHPGNRRQPNPPAGTGRRNERLSIPTPDHYLPLLYVIGTRQHGDPFTFPVEGVDGGSISMLAVRVG